MSTIVLLEGREELIVGYTGEINMNYLGEKVMGALHRIFYFALLEKIVIFSLSEQTQGKIDSGWQILQNLL